MCGAFLRSLTCSIGLIWWACGVLFAQDPVHRRYTVEDGLPSNKVYSVTQDSKGFLWFGTDAGASRFDGRSFTTFSTAEGMPDKDVLNIYEDTRGRIWFLLLNGKLCYWQEGELHHEGTDPGLGYGGITSGLQAMGEDAQGSIWFGGVYGSLVRATVEPRVDSVFDRRGEFGLDGFIMSVAKDRDGTLMIFQGSGLWVPEGKGIRRVPLQHRIIHLGMVTQAALPGRPALALTEEGVSSIRADGTCERIAIPVELDTTISRRCWEDNEGSIWVQRRTKGIDLLMADEGAYEHRVLFINERVNHALVGRDGMRWLCTDQGVVAFSREQQRARTFMLPGQGGVLSLHRSMAGQLLVGTEENGLFRLGSDDLVPIELPADELGPGRVMRMAKDLVGSTWVGTDHALYELDGTDRARLVRFDFGRVDRSVSNVPMVARCVSVGPDGRVLSSSAGLQEVIHGPGAPRRMNIKWEEIGHHRVEVVHQDPKGRAWFSSGEWLRVLDGNELRSIDLRGAGRGQRISDITDLGVDSLLIATRGGGLVLVRPSGAVGAYGGTEVGTQDIRRVRVIGDTIWMATSAGILAMGKDAGGMHERLRITEIAGLPSLDCRDMLPLGNGQLAVATARGVSILPIKTDHRLADGVLSVHFPLVIGNDSVISPYKVVAVVAGRTLLTVHVRPVTYQFGREVELEWRIAPNGAWRPVSNGMVSLVDHPVGQYRFEVRARFKGAPWSAYGMLSISASAPWYLRPWALLLFVLGGVVMLAGLWSIVHRIQQARELRRLHGLQLLSEERRRIAADVHDDLGADLSHLLGQARMVQGGGGDVDNLVDGIGRTMERIDDIIWSLDPERDNVRSTADFIEGWVRNYAYANGLGFRSNIKVGPDERPIHTHHRRELALVVKEAMRNIVKHAQATTVQLTIAADPEEVTLELQDDGVLSPVGQVSERRSGTANMERRIRKLGGRMRFEAVVPRGTRMILMLPSSGMVTRREGGPSDLRGG